MLPTVILMGDFNLPISHDYILDLMTSHDLRDIYGTKHENTHFNTHQAGSQRIDYVLGTSKICCKTNAIGYESTKGNYDTDHRGIFLDIEYDILSNYSPPFRRKLHAKNATQVYKYRRKLHKILKAKDVYKRTEAAFNKIKKGINSRTLHKQLEQINKDITRAMIKSAVLNLLGVVHY